MTISDVKKDNSTRENVKNSTLENETVLTVENLKTYYPVLGGFFKRQIGEVKAVDGVSFKLNKGETLALVGESGCGKTTIGNTILNLVPATEGKVYLKDKLIVKGTVDIEKKIAREKIKEIEREKREEKKALREAKKMETLEESKERKERIEIETERKKKEKRKFKEARKDETKEEMRERKEIEKKRRKEEIELKLHYYNWIFAVVGALVFYILLGLGVELFSVTTLLANIGLMIVIDMEIFLEVILAIDIIGTLALLFIYRKHWQESFYKGLETSLGIFLFMLWALFLNTFGTNAILFFHLIDAQEAGFLILTVIAITLFNPMIYVKIYMGVLIRIDDYMKLHGMEFKNPDQVLVKYFNTLMNKVNVYSKDVRKRVQIVFQDPDSSLNPRWKIVDIIGEPLRALLKLSGAKKIRRKVLQLLETVSMKNEHLDRYPHEFSGGQKQRIVISRALASNPDVIVLDEPTSALDVSVQAQILNLLKNLQKKFNMAFLFITHDLSVVQHIADRVAVMYLGKFVEIGKVDDVFYNPSHPYTKALLSARPTFDPSSRTTRIILKGEIPSPINPPMGCAFHPRCYAQDQHICDTKDPVKIKISDDHYMWCKPFKK